MHVPSLVKIPWQYSSYHPENKNMGVSRAENSVKQWQNLPISNPKPDLLHINPSTNFGYNPLTFTQVIVGEKENMGVSRADNSIKLMKFAY